MPPPFRSNPASQRAGKFEVAQNTVLREETCILGRYLISRVEPGTLGSEVVYLLSGLALIDRQLDCKAYDVAGNPIE